MILYFLTSRTCAACKVATPELNAVVARRFDFTVIRREIDYYADGRDNIYGWRPKSTPAYAMTFGGELLLKHEGTLKQAALNKFIDDAKREMEERAAQRVAAPNRTSSRYAEDARSRLPKRSPR